MLNTCVSADAKSSLHIIDDHFLSIMTTLFIEGMAIDRQQDRGRYNWTHPGRMGDTYGKGAHFPEFCSKQTEAIALKEYGTRKAQSYNSRRRSSREDSNKTIRTFILGLSDVFNNLLMGIWGNLSLINMSIDRTSPLSKRVFELEQLIQSGSALINGIFGYLGERRIVAKNIRLNQLIQEINESLPIDGSHIKGEIVQASLVSPAGQNYASMIAASLARMLAQLMERIDHQHRLISQEKDLLKTVRYRLRIVERLMKKGWKIITLLNHYAGMDKFEMAKMNLKALIKHLANRFAEKHSHLKVSCELAHKLPLIHANRTMLKYVLEQLMDNAAEAMPLHGALHMDVRTLSSESPRDRCVAHRWVDSIVVTITDTGHGMDMNTLLHIFDPFYTGSRNSIRLGMGLTASWGIIKSHGGYIHVRSKIARGSTIKIYLPVRRADESGGENRRYRIRRFKGTTDENPRPHRSKSSKYPELRKLTTKRDCAS